MDWRSRLSSFEEHEPSGSYFLIIWEPSAPFSFAIMNTTIPTETELSSVNSILMALGQAPINRIFNDENGQLVYVNPEVALCHSLLLEVNTDVQNEGWVFNREGHYPLTPEADGTITVPNAILRMDVWENDIYRSSNLVQREGKLYDKLHHTYEFPPTKPSILTLYGSGTMKTFRLLLSATSLYVLLVVLLHNYYQPQIGGASEHTRSCSSCYLYGVRM